MEETAIKRWIWVMILLHICLFGILLCPVGGESEWQNVSGSGNQPAGGIPGQGGAAPTGDNVSNPAPAGKDPPPDGEKPGENGAIDFKTVFSEPIGESSGETGGVKGLFSVLEKVIDWLVDLLKGLLGADSPPKTDTADSGGKTPGKDKETPGTKDKPSDGKTNSDGKKKESQSYTVVAGDSLSAIAERFLGSADRYPEIVEANKDKYPSLLKNPNLIHPGWELTIPGGKSTGEKVSGSGKSGSGSTSSTTGNTSTPTKVPPPPPGASGGKPLLGWLQQAGLQGDSLRTAWAIGMAESTGNPMAHNPNWPDNSYGLFQINMLDEPGYYLGAERRARYGLSSNEELYDPATNIRAMKDISSNFTDWTPWSTYKSSAYYDYLDQYPPR